MKENGSIQKGQETETIKDVDYADYQALTSNTSAKVKCLLQEKLAYT